MGIRALRRRPPLRGRCGPGGVGRLLLSSLRTNETRPGGRCDLSKCFQRSKPVCSFKVGVEVCLSGNETTNRLSFLPSPHLWHSYIITGVFNEKQTVALWHSCKHHHKNSHLNNIAKECQNGGRLSFRTYYQPVLLRLSVQLLALLIARQARNTTSHFGTMLTDVVCPTTRLRDDQSMITHR